jgi:hypothetical protein
MRENIYLVREDGISCKKSKTQARTESKERELGRYREFDDLV